MMMERICICSTLKKNIEVHQGCVVYCVVAPYDFAKNWSEFPLKPYLSTKSSGNRGSIKISYDSSCLIHLK